MSSIKLDIFTPFTPIKPGGNASATWNLAQQLSGSCEVKLHTFNSSSQKNKTIFKAGLGTNAATSIEIVTYPTKNIPFVGEHSYTLVKALSKSKSDILHIHGLARPFNNILLQKFVKGKPIVLTAHGLDEGLQKAKVLPFSKIAIRILISYLNQYSHIIALSFRDKNLLVSLGCKTPITAILNGIDLDKFRKRTKIVEEEDIPKILCVSRFDNYKGFEDLLIALAIVKKSHRFMSYLVGLVSDQEYFESIKQLSQKLNLNSMIKIVPSASDPELTDCYKSCDIFVFPSRMDTLPLTILEAMHFGLPIISTCVGGIPEVIVEGVNGLLVEPRMPSEMASKIITLLDVRALGRKMGEKNREKSKNFNWENVSNQVKKLYDRLLQP